MNTKIKNRWVAGVLILLTFTVSTAFTGEGDKDKELSANERFVLSTLYSQVAGEFKALQLQAYNIASERVKDLAAANKLTGKEAIVLDIDETVLETIPYQAKMITEGFSFPTEYEEYIQESICKPVPGSLQFLKYCDSLGINIFYVSNRTAGQLNATITNLKKYNYPQPDDKHVILKGETSSKEERRTDISKSYNIILLIGDNLGDFSDLFKTDTNDERNKIVLENSASFGSKFIVLPNPSYGDWEGLIYRNNWKLSPEEMDKMRKEAIKNLYDF